MSITMIAVYAAGYVADALLLWRRPPHAVDEWDGEGGYSHHEPWPSWIQALWWPLDLMLVLMIGAVLAYQALDSFLRKEGV